MLTGEVIWYLIKGRNRKNRSTSPKKQGCPKKTLTTTIWGASNWNSNRSRFPPWTSQRQVLRVGFRASAWQRVQPGGHPPWGEIEMDGFFVFQRYEDSWSTGKYGFQYINIYIYQWYECNNVICIMLKDTYNIYTCQNMSTMHTCARESVNTIHGGLKTWHRGG